MSRGAAPLVLDDGQRELLESLSKSRTAEHRVVQRARVLLDAGDGVSNSDIAVRVGVSRQTVLAWRGEFTARGLAKLGRVAAGRGRKASIPQETIDRIVELTLHHKPEGATHWSCRSMARRAGVSPATVQRVWSARGLKPHLVETFKLSNDKRFEEKLVDVVGLYLNPPDQAVVLCMDEKSQIQALDRSQPGLPLKKGRAGTMTHDYKRHGTTTLFAALDVATGELLKDCMPKHRHQEFLKFMRQIEHSVPKDLSIHVVLDNYSPHKHPTVNRWLELHPRVEFHFTPTSASWLNLVERFFSELTERKLRRLAVSSVDELVDSITQYIDRRNENPKPFVWTATVRQIMQKINKANETLATLH